MINISPVIESRATFPLSGALLFILLRIKTALNNRWNYNPTEPQSVIEQGENNGIYFATV